MQSFHVHLNIVGYWYKSKPCNYDWSINSGKFKVKFYTCKYEQKYYFNKTWSWERNSHIKNRVIVFQY